MRSIFAFLTALWLLVSCTACAPVTPKNSFAYADKAFSATIQGTYTPKTDEGGVPRSFAATVTAGAPVDGDPTRRDLTVTFTSPDTLAGVTVTATLTPASEGTVQRNVTFAYPSEYGNIQVPAEGEAFDGLLRFAEALLPIGDVAETSPKADDGSYTVTRKQNGRTAVFAFSDGVVLPVGVTVTTPREILQITVTP